MLITLINCFVQFVQYLLTNKIQNYL